jgi:hypothetical protein
MLLRAAPGLSDIAVSSSCFNLAAGEGGKNVV